MNKMDCKVQRLDNPIQVKTCKREQYESYKSKNLTVESIIDPNNREKSIDHGAIYYIGGCTDRKVVEFDLAFKLFISTEARIGVIMYPGGSASFCETDSIEQDRIVDNIYARGSWRQVGNSYKFTITEYLTNIEE